MGRISINPDVLAWALRDSDRSQFDLAQVTNRSSGEVTGWMQGTSAPTLGDLRKIGKLLGRTPFFFALPAPPKGRTYAGRFRAAIGGTIEPGERALEVDALRTGQRIQDIGKRHVSVDSFNVPFKPDTNTEKVADYARSWLHWDSKVQFDATSKTAAFKKLRLAVEDRQIIVMVADAKTERFCGFSLPDPILPLIFINKAYDLSSVRSFTLMHELGHILLAQRRVCYGGDVGVEQWCNRFAASFLMPSVEVTRYLEKSNLTFASPTDTEPVRRVANRFKTSWLAAAIRLEELGSAPSGIANLVKSTRPEPRDQGFSPDGGKTTPALRVDEFGGTFVRVLSLAVDSGELSRLDATRILRVSGQQLNETRVLAESEVG